MRKKAKAVLKEAARLNKNKKLKNIPKVSRKKYTDKEKEELKKLRNELRKYQRRLNKINRASMLTMKDIKSFLLKDLGSPLAQAGAFTDDNYDRKDFRDVLKNHPDLILEIEDNIEKLSPEFLTETDPEAQDYTDKISELQNKINQIKTTAENRKEKEKLKAKVDAIQSKQDYKDALTLIDRIDKGGGAISALKEGERATVDFVKRQVAKEVVKNIKLDPDMDSSDAARLKSTLYSTIAFNPKEGIRTFIRESVTNEVVSKYGQDAGELASSLTDIATGKGSLRFVGLSIFKGVINRSNLNPSVMAERAEELIAAGESTKDKENIKRLGRDVAIDVAKNIIKSGGNIYAAIPMALKDILFDTGRAYMRSKKEE